MPRKDCAEERNRLELVREIEALSANPDPSFDALTDMAAATCEQPIALVSLVDQNSQIITSRHDTTLTDYTTTREASFSYHAITTCGNSEVFEVSDTHLDPRFRNHVLVTSGPLLRFYAGVPILPLDGHAVGTLCVLGTVPFALSTSQRRDLVRLANIAEQLLRLRLLTVANRSLLERVNNQLLETQRRRAQAVRSIAHDLATPLAAIRITGEALGLQAPPSPLAGQIRDLVGYARDAEMLVRDLRVVNSPDSDEPTLSTSSQRLVPMVERSVAQLFGPLASDVIDLNLDDVLGLVDEHAVHRIMTNLLTNAVGHNPPGTRVVVRLHLNDEGEAVLEVADDGDGIPSADRQRMLEPYETLGANGSGLGLAIIASLVAAHGGSVLIDGNFPSGTIVRIVLPA